MDVRITTEEFLRLQQDMSSKDMEIVRLKERVAALEEERDQWRVRALATQVGPEPQEDEAGREGAKGGLRYIVLSAMKLRSVLEKIQDVNVLSVVTFVLQKALPKGTTAEEVQNIAEVVPLPERASLKLTAEGDVHVEGDWNDVHDNGTVTFE